MKLTTGSYHFIYLDIPFAHKKTKTLCTRVLLRNNVKINRNAIEIFSFKIGNVSNDKFKKIAINSKQNKIWPIKGPFK